MDRIREYLDQAGLLDTEEFPAIKDDVTELARETSRRCIGPGRPRPACSASCQQFFRSTFGSRPSR
ncbi:hypothetical protein ACFYPB_42830 [Streptomyces olivaceoviridis]|uniref:hypothetical protein n=1 Tax=Streptomyces olivaceoviridis TaxID=1921 RepID=UPI0036B72F2D